MLLKSTYKLLLLSALFLPFCVVQAGTCEEWEGLYAGFSLGYNKTEADLDSEVQNTTYFTSPQDAPQMNPLLSEDIDEDNLSGSILLGINKQNKRLVYGLEMDLTFSNYEEKNDTGNIFYLSQPAHTFRIENELESNWLMSIRPRIGYATKKSLFFLSAGPVLTHIDYTFKFEETFNNDRDDFSEKDWEWGWSGSVGYEHILNNNWRLKVEYLYYRFNDIVDAKSQLATNTGDGFIHDMDLEINSFRIGFVKKF